MARIRAVLFDIDGTLLDSNDAWSHAWLDALRGHGLLVPLDRVRACLGMHPDEVIAELTDIAPRSAEARAIADRRSAILREHYASDVGPLPGARALVDRLRSRGLVCGAVSGARRAEVEGLLRAAIVDDLMEVVVCDEDLREAPERGEAPSVGLVRIALARAGTSPTETAFVGDTPHDVETGRRAGVAVVALRSGASGTWTSRARSRSTRARASSPRGSTSPPSAAASTRRPCRRDRGAPRCAAAPDARSGHEKRGHFQELPNPPRRLGSRRSDGRRPSLESLGAESGAASASSASISAVASPAR